MKFKIIWMYETQIERKLKKSHIFESKQSKAKIPNQFESEIQADVKP